MCESVEVSRATVCRDLDYLSDRIGLPVVWDGRSQINGQQSSLIFGDTDVQIQLL